MACGRFLTLFQTTSRSSLAKPGRQFFYNTKKSYDGKESNGNRSRMEERAPSTAEEFQRFAEEKAMEAKMASKNVNNKSCGDARKGNIDDPKVESVYKEQKLVVDYSKRGCD